MERVAAPSSSPLLPEAFRDRVVVLTLHDGDMVPERIASSPNVAPLIADGIVEGPFPEAAPMSLSSRFGLRTREFLSLTHTPLRQEVGAGQRLRAAVAGPDRPVVRVLLFVLRRKQLRAVGGSRQ